MKNYVQFCVLGRTNELRFVAVSHWKIDWIFFQKKAKEIILHEVIHYPTLTFVQSVKAYSNDVQDNAYT